MCKILSRTISIIAIISMLLLTAFVSGVPVPAYAKAEIPVEYVITLITDSNGLSGENSEFNDAAYAGLTNAERRLGINFNVIESLTPNDYDTNIQTAMSNGSDLIVTVGFTMEAATTTAAENNPTQKFATVEAFVDLPNVTCISFKEQEGAFLVGVIAGLTTQTNVVGFIGGIEIAPIQEFEYSFKAGVLSANPSVEFVVDYLESFEDVAAGYLAAQGLLEAGADVIFQVAGYSGHGVIQAADDLGFWAIGVDADQSYLAPDAVLCSMVKNIEIATYTVAKSLVEGTITGGKTEYGLVEDGVWYSDDARNVPKKISAKLQKYVKAICKGSIIVPYDEITFNEFLLQ